MGRLGRHILHHTTVIAAFLQTLGFIPEALKCGNFSKAYVANEKIHTRFTYRIVVILFLQDLWSHTDTQCKVFGNGNRVTGISSSLKLAFIFMIKAKENHAGNFSQCSNGISIPNFRSNKPPPISNCWLCKASRSHLANWLPGFSEWLPNQFESAQHRGLHDSHRNTHQTCQLIYLQDRAAMSKAHQASSRAFFRERFSRIMGRNFTFGVIWAVLSDQGQVFGEVEKKNLEDVSSVALAR